MNAESMNGLNGLNGLNGHTRNIAQRVKSADDKVVAFVQERPLVAVGAALVVGYLIGRVLTRVA